MWSQIEPVGWLIYEIIARRYKRRRKWRLCKSIVKRMSHQRPMEAYNSSVSFVNSAEINKNVSGTSQVSNGVGGGVISTVREVHTLL